MEVIYKRIDYSKFKTIRLRPLYDCHIGNALCDEHALKTFISCRDDNLFYIGGGDFLDAVTVKDPRYSKSIDKTMSSAIIDEQIEMGCDLLSPIKDKIIGFGTGNHEATILKHSGTDPIRRICKALNILYAGYSCYYKLALSKGGAAGRTIRIRAHHGAGGGRTGGASLTRYEKDLKSYDADIFLFGHSHGKVFRAYPQFSISGKRNFIAKERYIIECGTFLKTMQEGVTSYSELANFPPTTLGGFEITITPQSSGRFKIKVMEV